MLVLAPHRDGGAPRRLIVVPDGLAVHLPSEALIWQGGDGGKKGRMLTPGFWAEDAEISYATSATQALVGESWGGTGGRPSSLLAVGNSGSIRCDNRSRKLKQFFAPLAHVKKEIRALAGSYPWRKATVLLDEEAGEGRVKTALAAGSDIVHVAAHGVLDDASWWRSALLLRPETASGEDGFLTALEIADLSLKARLVVLSGCGTGSGTLFQGEGIKGLSGSFLRAGADYVMVSLWSVDDRMTAAHHGEFRRILARGDRRPAPALGEAGHDLTGRIIPSLGAVRVDRRGWGRLKIDRRIMPGPIGW
jgi:hypothetical protein